MADKKCPRCGQWSVSSALRCDCGYDFQKETIEESYNDKKELYQPQPRYRGEIAFVVSGISAVLFVMSVFQIAYYVGDQSIPGFMPLFMGILQVFFLRGVTWLANPALFFAYFFSSRKSTELLPFSAQCLSSLLSTF